MKTKAEIIKAIEDLCIKCNKNKATITYAESILNLTHGFSERICQECLDKQIKESPVYKKGYEESKKEFLEMIKDIYDRLLKKDFTPEQVLALAYFEKELKSAVEGRK